MAQYIPGAPPEPGVPSGTGQNSDIHLPAFLGSLWFLTPAALAILTGLVAGYRSRIRRFRKQLAEHHRLKETLTASHTEMEQAKQMAELRHAENEKLLSAISAIFIAVDTNGVVFQWNRAAERFFGIPHQRALKHTLTELLSHCIGPDHLDAILSRGLGSPHPEIPEHAPPTDVLEFSVDIKTHHQAHKLLSCNISPIRHSNGTPLGFLLLAEDITNRKEEEMLRNLSKKLESLGQMATSIAHEIKTPLQYIDHNARFVSDSFNDFARLFEVIDDALKDLEKSGKNDTASRIRAMITDHDMGYILREIPAASDQIINGVERVSDIIKSMNEFSHPGRGFKEKADLNQLLRTTLVMIQSKIKKSADIRLELSGDLPEIPCYPGELNQVFMNMLVNALDAVVETGRWGTITIRTEVEDADAVVSISDTGCGIPEQNREYIFNPFYTTKEVGKGTGQGLSLAHKVIIEKHGGKLDFTSTEGEGTTFHVRLPFTPDANTKKENNNGKNSFRRR